MSVTPGTRIGSYEVKSPLGEGGMGVVFRALDIKLQRDVALKLLPPDFADDPDRLLRFQREAQVLASLNHPNIAQIYGFEEANGSQCIVMELVEGETLQERLARGPIPTSEALSIAKQIAEALEVAHEKGIVHRDLKPANVKVTPDGKVKVLDFGLAKAIGGRESATLSNSPTMMSASVPGMILGTAAYMSPEQARGFNADQRSDIFAFGCVLFEMLTGRRAFLGDTIADVFASIMKSEPDWSLLPTDAPASVLLMLRRSLQKDRARRMRNIGDAAVEIEQAMTEPMPAPLAAREAVAAPNKAIYIGISAVVVAILAITFFLTRNSLSTTQLQTIRFSITPPERFFLRGAVPQFALSPDGKDIAFIAEGGTRKLWVRSLDSSDAREIPGTENARIMPIWSPDGKYLAFFSAPNNLQKVSIADGSTITICAMPGFPTGTWNTDNTIVLAINDTLYRVSANGGELKVILAPQASRGELRVEYPEFLPDGDHFIYTVNGADREAAGIWVMSLKSNEKKRLLPIAAPAHYFSGYLLYLRDGKIAAQSFDVKNLAVADEPTVLTADAMNKGFIASFHVSSNGNLAWAEKPKGAAQLVWHDRIGNKTRLAIPAGLYRQVRLSPDGKRAAVSEGDIPATWLLEMSSGVFSRITPVKNSESDMVWSPDGSELAFTFRGNLHRRKIGAADAQPFFDSPDSKWLHDWSPDGKYLVFAHDKGVYTVPTSGEQKPITLAEDDFAKDEFRVSPDNRWIAYNSDQSGRSEVYIAEFPTMAHRRQVSNAGGAIPRWRSDMKELYYLRMDGMLMAVPVRPGEALETAAPQELFRVDVPVSTVLDQYDVTSDGKKFVVIENEQNATSPPIQIVVNWLEELRQTLKH